MRGMDTFVVRVWASAVEGSGDPHLRGVLEHVRSGESREFQGALELVERLRELAARRGEGERATRTHGGRASIESEIGREG